MKIITLLFLTIFLSRGCSETKNQELKTTIIEYKANSRGRFYKITVQNQIVSVSRDRKGIEAPVTTKLSNADWKEIISDFKTIDLDELPNLKPPTEKRFYDGAMMANLKITYKDKVYETLTFDNGYPPEEIAKLVNKINSFAKTEE